MIFGQTAESVLRIARDILGCLFFLVLIGLCVEAALFLETTKETMTAALKVAKQFPAQTDLLRRDLTSEIREVRIETLGQVNLLRKDVTGILKTTEKDVIRIANKTEQDTVLLVDQKISNLQNTIDGIAQSTDKKLATVENTLARVDHIAAQFETTGDLLFDCEGNPNCFANRSIGTLQAVEKFAKAGQKTMESVDKATPAIVKNVQDTTAASMEASKNTAATMANLEKQSRPLPLAIRFAPQAVQAILFGIGILK